MGQTLRRHLILDRRFFASLLAISIPIALQNMISFGVNMMDSVMLGSFGDVAISAANVGGQPFAILMSLGFGLSSGGGVLIAQYWGRKDTASIRKVMRISMQLVFVASLTVTVICLLIPETIARFYTKDEAIVQAAVSYLTLVVFSYLPYSISNNYMMSLRAVEQVKVSAVIYAISFFVNVFFNYVFIFGAFGAPRLEVRGAAVGTVIARCSELAMVLVYMYRREKVVGFRLGDCLHRERDLLPSYMEHSLPVLGNEMLWGVGFSMISVIIGQISSVFMAAYSIVGILNQLAFVTLSGAANGAAVITGKTVGEGSRARVQKVANTLLLLAVAVSVVNCVFLLLVGPLFLNFYHVTPETREAAASLIRELALLQLVIGFDVTCIVGVLRGGGDTRFAFYNECGTLWLIALPLGFLTGVVWKMPVTVVYLCLRSDSVFKSIFSFFRLRSGKWIRNVTVREVSPQQEQTTGSFAQ